MLDRKYGKCLSNLWQMFGKKIMKMAKLLAILIFHYKMATFWQYWYYSFCNSYFLHTIKFLSLTIKKKSVL